MGRVLLPALVILLSACSPVAGAIVQAQDSVSEAISHTQSATAAVVAQPALALQEKAQEALPVSPPPAAVPLSPATDLILRFEVTSPAVYTKRYAGVICPGGSSGPTIGIGADLGQQTQQDIARDWAEHPDVRELVTASGAVGNQACQAWKAQHRSIRTPYELARRVFDRSTLPRYTVAAARALHRGWDTLPANAQGADVSLGYNRGWSMVGERNREKRDIRDACVPGADLPCNAAALRSMCRLWVGTPNGKGLCARRNAEANLVTQ